MTAAPIIRRFLDNGMPFLVECLPHVRSASVSVWVETGARDEMPEEHGISHFLEHTFFKGTPTRSAVRIAQEIDALGGEINAFTGREQTAFYVKVLADRLPEAADVLADVLMNATFDPEELDRERQVILEEIRMVEDDPEEWVFDLHAANRWGETTPMGRTILGTEESVRRLGPDEIRAYLARRYVPDRMVVAAAGSLDADALFAQMNRTLGRLPVASARDNRPQGVPVVLGNTATVTHFRDLEQVHLCVGGQALAAGHADRFGMYVLNDLLGGGSSSRLFLEIRERRGLAYSVYSGLSAYRDCGEITVYAGCGTETAPEVLRLIHEEIARLRDVPVEADELARIKGHLKGQLVLGLESTFSRMSRLAQDELLWHAVQPIEALLAGIDAVDAEQVLRLARFAFDPARLSTTSLGAARNLAVAKPGR